MVDYGEDIFLTLDMINLFQFDDCTLFETLECEGILFLVITAMFNETHTSESSRTKRRQNVKVV